MKRLVLLFLMISSAILSAQESVDVKLDSPNATIYTHLYFLQSDSCQPEKAAKVILPNATLDAEKAVIMLKQILDGKGLFVNFNNIPKSPSYKDSLTNNTAYKFVLFPDKKGLDMKYNTDQKRMDQVIKNSVENFNKNVE